MKFNRSTPFVALTGIVAAALVSIVAGCTSSNKTDASPAATSGAASTEHPKKAEHPKGATPGH